MDLGAVRTMPTCAFSSADGERQLNAAGVSVRCLQTGEGGIPERSDAPGLVAIAGRGY